VVLTAVVLSLEANSLASELESSPDSYRRDKESTRETYRRFGWIGSTP
jgi:hypothetical protein